MFSNDKQNLAISIRSSPLSLSESEAIAKRLNESGQFFLAYDFAQSSLLRFPESLALKQSSALALIRTGALNEAKKILEPLCARPQPDQLTLKRLYQELRKLTSLPSRGDDEDPDLETLKSLARVTNELGIAANFAKPYKDTDEETLGLHARVHKDLWRRSGKIEDAHSSREIYLQSFLATGGIWTGINAATMSFMVGEASLGSELAQQVLNKCLNHSEHVESGSQYWTLATMGEAYLLMGRAEEAIAHYRKAAEIAGDNHFMIISALQQLQLLKRHGFFVPDELLRLLTPPAVVVFTGHMIDSAERKEPRFPTYIEADVRRQIDRELDLLDAKIGYSSAANGSDILFIEAMQERGAEVNIVLPFAIKDFIRVSVHQAGPRWVARFHRALKLAASIKYVTEEPMLQDTVLFHFLGRMFYGLGETRARSLLTKPTLLTVWDGKQTKLKGGTADSIASWPVPERIVRIDIGKILRSSNAKPEARHTVALSSTETNFATSLPTMNREIKAMLFADIAGYSRMQEEMTPAFIYLFLQYLADHLVQKVEFVNTWGDSIFAVDSSAKTIVDYALSLQEIVCETDWSAMDFPAQMGIRIGLHAGPVFASLDPITGRPNYYGAHVNRAARIEPVTIPGNIYGSEQFVSLLAIEQAEISRVATATSSTQHASFVCDWIGTLDLAKNFASQTLYHIRRNDINVDTVTSL